MSGTPNEDYHCVRLDLGLFVVADGMGGHPKGEVASQAAVEGIVEFVESTVGMLPSQVWPVRFDPGQSDNQNRLRVGFSVGNRRLASENALLEERREMATTAVAVLIDGPIGTVAHVGDSRAYRFRGSQLEQLTRDHSWVEEQLQAGELTEAAARDHPRRNIVTRAISGSGDLDVELQELQLRTEDRFLLCSDGIFNVLSDAEIEEVLGGREADLAEACQTLVRGASEGGGSDDMTAIIVEIDAV